MSSFDLGFYKKAAVDAGAGRKILKGISMLSGIMGGALAGGGTGLMAKGLFQDSFRPSESKPRKSITRSGPGVALHTETRDTSEDALKDRVLDHAPWVGAVLGGILGGMHSSAAFRPLNVQRKLAFEQGFQSKIETHTKTAMSSGTLLLKNIWETSFQNAGESLGRQAGSTFGDRMAKSREQAIQDRTLTTLVKDERFSEGDLQNLPAIAGMTGVQERAAEVAAGAGMLLGSVGLLKASRPSLNARASWAAQVANAVQRKVQGPRFKPSLGNLALTLAAGSLAAGFVGSVLAPPAAEIAGTAAARLRDKDIVKGVERYYSQKQASRAMEGFDRAKTAASVIGVMPGVTSGLRTMKSFGKIRTARPVSGQSIGPRAKPNATPSPSKSPNAGVPGAANTQVTSASVPKASDYGSRLMGRWI